MYTEQETVRYIRSTHGLPALTTYFWWSGTLTCYMRRHVAVQMFSSSLVLGDVVTEAADDCPITSLRLAVGLRKIR